MSYPYHQEILKIKCLCIEKKSSFQLKTKKKIFFQANEKIFQKFERCYSYAINLHNVSEFSSIIALLLCIK